MATFALKPDTTTGASYFHGLSGPSPFFAGSDMQALGVLRAARELGLSVPRDLSVVGYDDLPVIEWTDPPLTTVRQPLREMAAMATEMVLSMAKGAAPTNTRSEERRGGKECRARRKGEKEKRKKN